MLGEIGYFCLIMGTTFCCAQVFSFLGNKIFLQNVQKFFLYRMAHLQAIFLLCAFLILVLAYYWNDFSLTLVSTHSHSRMPLLYRIASAWGTHEGSLLLWVFLQASLGSSLVIFLKDDFLLKTKIIRIQGLLNLSLLLFIISAANPFHMNSSTFLEGEGLNPLLQDYGLLYHPPFLYLGYVGLSSAFSFSMASLLEDNVDAAWAKYLRPFVLASWGFLTFGLLLGSFWAYYELGWGGWWFWDPVENIALIPWMLTTGFIHVLIVAEQKKLFYGWVHFFGLLIFTSCLVGTFFVRSGLIVSVHTFAVDSTQGVFLISCILPPILLAFCLFLYRLNFFIHLSFLPSLKEWLFSGMILMTVLGVSIVGLGTFYPLIIEALTGRVMSVGAPYYEHTLLPVMIPFLIAIPMGPILSWNAKRDITFLKELMPALTISLATFGLGIYGYFSKTFFAWMMFSIAVWIIIGTILKLRIEKFKGFTSFGLGHIGFGITIIGMSLSSAGKQEVTLMMSPGQIIQFGGKKIKLERVFQGDKENYRFEQADIKVFDKQDKYFAILRPQRRLYQPQEIVIKESSIYSNGFYNLYSALGEYYGENRWLIRLYYHPFVVLIWVGGILIAIAAFISSIKRFKLINIYFFIQILLVITSSKLYCIDDKIVLAKELEREIKCPVCQGQTLEDSETEIAIAIKDYIKISLEQGNSVDHIKTELKKQFGEQILLFPTFENYNLFLWVWPFLIFIVIMGWWGIRQFSFIRR